VVLPTIEIIEPIFFSFRFTIGLNTFSVSRVEFFGITVDSAPAKRGLVNCLDYYLERHALKVS